MNIPRTDLSEFANEIGSEWRDDIAPFWLRLAPDEAHGGFRGVVNNDLTIDEKAEKGIILNSRILWTFSRAYHLFKDDAYLHMANRAFTYIVDHFFDRVDGGVFWTVDYNGQPLDMKKRTYAQAFALYGFTEYYSATGVDDSLSRAFDLYSLIETRCRDIDNDGYLETFDRDWTLAADQRLSEVDQDDKKSMNAHLHVLEAYTSLARATRDVRVLDRLRGVLQLFVDKIVHPDRTHLQMFFEEQWKSTSMIRSFGHDIEASWLLCEAAKVLGSPEISRRTQEVALVIADSVYAMGLDDNGALLYEADPDGIVNREKHWWVQAEAVVGFINAWRLTDESRYFVAARRVWDFIRANMIDRVYGEWYWKTSDAGLPSEEMPKLSQWKCPYHNGRMCFEVRERLMNREENSWNGAY